MDQSRSPVPVPRVGTQGPDPLIGRLINDRYKIAGVIARGGMGKVYRAEQAPLGRLVALKVLSPNYNGDSDPEFHRRFFLEASVASRLTHPNTVTIFDYGKTEDDVYYIAMELLEGRTLYAALREAGHFDAERTVHIGRQICRSLREAHGLGVIHRDLKPANVYLVQHSDESDFVKVLDFGLVKNLNEKGEELTQAGLFMGSPKYMSPEQIRGEHVDSRVDVYALGVLMFEMLTGKVPFDRPSSVNILMAHIQEQVPAMSAFNANISVPPQLEQVVRKCMAKDRDDRYSSMDEVLVALKRYSVATASMNVSGEHRLGEPLDSSVISPLPAPAPLQVEGELLSGGTPSAASSQALSAAPPVMRPAPSLATGPKRPPWLFAAFATFAAVGGFWATSSGLFSASSDLPDLPVAEPAPEVTSAPPTPVAPTAAATSPASTGIQAIQQVEPEPTRGVQDRAVVVSLMSTPLGATVVIDGKPSGVTPLQLEWTGADAAFGRRVTFVFQHEGFRDLTLVRQIRTDHLDVEAPPMEPTP